MDKIPANYLFILLAVVGIFVSGCNGDKPTDPTNQRPIARIVAAPTSGYAPLVVHFDGSDSYDPDGTITSYYWDFKDGIMANGAVVDHLFESSGSYAVTLTVTDNRGKESSTSVAISIGAPQYTIHFILGQGVNDPYPDEVLELIVEGQTRCRTPLGGECQSGAINLTAGEHTIGVRLVQDTGATGGSPEGTEFHVWIETDEPVEIIPSDYQDTVNGIDNISETTIVIQQ